MAYKVGELMTPDSVGDMAEQDANDVNITGGSGHFDPAIVLNATVDLNSYPTSTLLAAGTPAANIVYCTDGDGGDPCLAVYDPVATAWKRVALGATISAT